MNPELRKRLSDRAGAAMRESAPWIERLALQIEFGRAFAQLHRQKATAWGQMLDQAEAAAGGLSPASLAAGVLQIESTLAEIGLAAKTYTIHCVGHGHIDMNWMWSWPETVSATRDTFASVLSFMRQYPQFTYSQSQVAVYELIQQFDPPMFEEIKTRVAEGRWEVTAMHWVEGDKNLAHGESIARHFLLSRRWIERELGLKPEDVPVDWEPDTFGHANTIPNFLVQGAGKYYYCCRAGGGFEHPMVGEPRPPVFWWKGTDGSRVLVFKEITWYNSEVNIGRNIALPLVEFSRTNGLMDWMNVYGVGNHGGGPTRAEIDLYHAMQDWPIYPKVVFGTAKAYFEKIDADIAARNLAIPEIDHELNFEFTGCYTSQSLIKQANRYAERYCLDAEALDACAPSPSFSPSEKGDGAEREDSGTTNGLRTAWTHVLFNQFHDILPGSGVRQTREHALALFQEVGAITGMIKRRAAEALASNLNTASLLPETPEGEAESRLIQEGKANAPYVAGAGIQAGLTGHSQGSSGGRRFRPFVVWNPSAWERTEFVKVDLYDMDLDPERIVARDEDGLQWPTVILEQGHDWAHDKITLLFPATVPALGYRTYLFCEGDVTAEVPRVEALSESRFRVGEMEYELDRYRVGIRQAAHRTSGVEFGTGYEPIGNWEAVVETPRGMTAWALGELKETEGTLSSDSYRVKGLRRNVATSQASSDSVAVVAEHRLRLPGSGQSSAVVRTLIGGLGNRVEFEADLDWREIGDESSGIPGLRIDFESLANVLDEEAVSICESPFGVVARQSGLGDVPTLRFATVQGANEAQPSAMTLLQDSKYGHEFDHSTLAMRVVRSSFDPDHAPEVAKSSFRYGIHFHTEKPSYADLVRLGTAFNHPFIVFPANLQEGTGALSKSFVTVKTPSVILTALKLAEDGEGLILRLVEYNGQDTEAEVELHSDLIGSRKSAAIVDLIERPTGGKAELNGNRLRVKVRAHSFITVRLS